MRRVVLIVLALVLVPSMVTATSYRCIYDGVTRSACCCPTPMHHEKAPATDQVLRAACCCTITQLTTAARPVGTMALSKLHPVVAPVVVTIEPMFAPVPVSVAAIERPHAPSGPPCSLLARHCSLLL